jgi:hypothetical protein
MSLTKSIVSGQEWRKEYSGIQLTVDGLKKRVYSAKCKDRNCDWCSRNRQMKNIRRLEASNHELSTV